MELLTYTQWDAQVYINNSLSSDLTQLVTQLSVDLDNLPKSISYNLAETPGQVSVIVIILQPEERRTYQPKCWDCNNKDEVNSPKILSDKDYQAWSQKYDK